ncbi:MAG: aminotransferase class IV, partial [Actinomycetes bacterium]
MSDGLTTASAGVWVGGPNGGALVDPAYATVSAFDHGLTVGDGVFETCKVVRGQAFAMTRHLRRLERSAAGLGLPVPHEELVRQASAAVL